MAEKITVREAAEGLKQKIGNVYTDRDLIQRTITDKLPSWQSFNTEASRDTIRHFVDGIGDFNPLYRNEEYARGTKYGSVIAPPCFLYSIIFAEGAYLGQGHGIHPYGSGVEWEWARPIWEGDQISWKAVIPSAIEVKPSRFAGEILFIYDEVEHFNQRGETVAWKKEWNICAARQDAMDKGIKGGEKVRRVAVEKCNT